MACPDRIRQLFAEKKAIDLHVNIGHLTAHAYIDGNPTGVSVRRQFSAEELITSNLAKIGLRTHYSFVDIPKGSEYKFVPSVSINWIGLEPQVIDSQLSHISAPAIIWFQSFRDPYHCYAADDKYRKAIAARGKEEITISHTNEFGQIKEAAMQILEIARARQAIIATPHSNHERTIPLILEAAKMGLTILWVHPDSRLINTPLDLQEAITRQFPGQVYVERAAVFPRDGIPGFYSAEKTVNDVRAIGMEHIIFTTDLGRYKETDPLMPDEGLQWYMEKLTEAGLTIEEAEMGIVNNPNKLIYKSQ